MAHYSTILRARHNGQNSLQSGNISLRSIMISVVGMTNYNRLCARARSLEEILNSGNGRSFGDVPLIPVKLLVKRKFPGNNGRNGCVDGGISLNILEKSPTERILVTLLIVSFKYMISF